MVHPPPRGGRTVLCDRGAVLCGGGGTKLGSVANCHGIVIVGFVVMALARFIPLGVAQIVIGLAAVVALWPIGYRIWTSPDVHASGRELRPTATTATDV
jgi:hypothetical protein